jgi:hypothetical protein
VAVVVALPVLVPLRIKAHIAHVRGVVVMMVAIVVGV